jgi:UDP-N-acetylglucosamine diphosphorylase / glucose-1-phosphate thymidylyltransferase / UDP-N-acetylgalactosamine diphosphorylase / glucosamine-1-phosphate N-acetyltransferase / galactosamine-1-phosphate N-acetyltransferase
MKTIVFEDGAVGQLGLLTAARPACDLTIGATTLVEALGHFGPVRRAVRPHLARYIQAVAGRRVTVWGGSSAIPPLSPPVSSHGAILLLVNGRVVPSRDTLITLRSIVEAGHRTVVHHGDAIAAAVVHLSADGGGPDQAAVNAVLADATTAAETIDSLALPESDADIEMLSLPHEIIGAHERTIVDALAVQIDSGRFREIRPGLFAAAGAEIAEQVVVRAGPVVVDDGAEIGPFVCLDGPIWIGSRARINPHAWIRAGTAIGAECRVGGEVEATIMEPYSNKPHDGFLGHSHIGSWVNLAAGTITGNLKATYGPVRLHEPAADGSRGTIHTGRQFLGALVGDFVKTAINTSLPCGARIGIAATVGGLVPEQVAAFTNMVVAGGERTSAEQATIVLERMMARRGLELLEADREFLRTLAASPTVS